MEVHAVEGVIARRLLVNFRIDPVYSITRPQGRFHGLQLRSETWRIEPLEVEGARALVPYFGMVLLALLLALIATIAEDRVAIVLSSTAFILIGGTSLFILRIARRVWYRRQSQLESS